MFTNIHLDDRIELIKFFREQGIKFRSGWANITSDVGDSSIINPLIENDEQISLIYKKVLEINLRNLHKRPPISVKPAAGGEHGCWVKEKHYSVSCSLENVALANIVLSHVGKQYTTLQVLPADRKLFQATIGSNMRIFYAQEALNKKGMFMLGASLLRFATVSGLYATAGHGSTTGKVIEDEKLAASIPNNVVGPGFASNILSMNIIDPSGKPRLLDQNDPRFSAIRGAHLGMFGAITKQRVQCRPDTKLKRTAEAINMHTFLQRIEEGCFTNNEIVSAMCMPNYTKNEYETNGPISVLLVSFESVPLTTKNFNNTAFWDKLTMAPEIRTSDFFQLQKLLGRFPSLVPNYMKLATHLQIINKAGVSVGPAYTQYHYLPEYPRAKGLSDLDFLIPVLKNTSGARIKEIATTLNGKIKEFADKGFYVAVDAIYYRIFQGTHGGLSTSDVNHDTHWVLALDIVSDISAPGWQAFKEIIVDIMVNQFGGALHWGKTVFINGKLPSKTYMQDHFPDLKNFASALKTWHEDAGVPLEASPCLNDFDRQLLAEIPDPDFDKFRVQEIKEEASKIKMVDDKHEQIDTIHHPLVENISVAETKNDEPMSIEEEAKHHAFISKLTKHFQQNFFAKDKLEKPSREFHADLLAIQAKMRREAAAKAKEKNFKIEDTRAEDVGCLSFNIFRK